MAESHIVLRTSRRATQDVFLGPLAATTAAAEPSAGVRVEVDELERKDIPALTSGADVVAVAPSMPIKLIEPRDVADFASPAAQQVAWGVEAVKADTSPFTGDGIVVAVLDTGIDAAHPAFAGMNIVEKDFTGEGDGDVDGHGTHCAGTIFGRSTGNMRIGVAPGIRTALIGKVLGQQSGSTASLVEAIQWAIDNGAHVISMSLGFDFPAYRSRLAALGLPGPAATSRALEGYRENVQLFERLASLIRAQEPFRQAAIMVAAAGNESERDGNPAYEIAVSPPAVAEGLLSVGALGQAPAGLEVAPFSNTGANVSAPGVGIVSAKAGGGLRSMSGTSMATPHVAGLAALWAEKIKAAGPLTQLFLTGRLVGSCGTDGLATGFDPFDVGAGLACAPQA